MDYDLSRLGTRSFEQLVQALSLKVIGPGTAIFGDGPDGGREAMFAGRMSYPSRDDPWNGALVVQAKFRQRPAGSGKDIDWLLEQMHQEFSKYTRSVPAPLPAPDYLVFATNVTLSAVAGSGGKDRAAAYLEEFRRSLSLKGVALWDYDQLRAFLDADSEVRSSYSAWITPGDVLCAIIAEIKPKHSDLRGVISNYIQKEIQSEQFVNLGQAGHMAQDRIQLANVFIDLPVSEYGNSPSEIEERRRDPGYVEVSTAMRCLLNEGDKRLDEMSRRHGGASRLPVGRVVLVGGPGQGKTTVTQFLCQLHRVALLSMLGIDSPLPEVSDATDAVRIQISHEALWLPQVPRLPMRVELNKLASALASGSVSSLFDYVLKRIRDRTGRDLKEEDLRALFRRYPLLVALDGLDEVPASSNRAQTLSSVQDFLVDINEINGDLLLVATTRRQGYTDEWSPRRFWHLCLSPLPIGQALHCARRLARERWGADLERIDRLMGRLDEASSDDATARLLQTPLQVTIMTLLVETIGRPPKERWRLFNDYYQVICRREKERDIPAARLLNTFQADIDAIHQRVGFELQSHSERAGGTIAIMPLHRFEGVVRERLVHEGHTDADLVELETEIVRSALERLVFLVAPEAGAIGFEVRSLQEFMAAEWLLNGSDSQVQGRLRAIAPAAHWRNVFLFAAGKCFHDKQHLRDTLFAICGELNEGQSDSLNGAVQRAVLAGSRIAIDILEDGAVASQPSRLKAFGRLALRILDLPPCADQARIARLCRPELHPIYQAEVHRRLASSSAGAWRVLALLAKEIDWAREEFSSHWPQDVESAIEIMASLCDLDLGDGVLSHLVTSLRAAPPMLVLQAIVVRHRPLPEQALRRLPETLGILLSTLIADMSLHGAEPDRDTKGLRTSPAGMRDSGDLVKVHPGWRWLRSALNLEAASPAFELARVARQLSSSTFDGLWRISCMPELGVPWTLRMCLNEIHHASDAVTIADAIDGGLVGDADDWRAAEQGWASGHFGPPASASMITAAIKECRASGSVDAAGIPLHAIPVWAAHWISMEQLSHWVRAATGPGVTRENCEWLVEQIAQMGRLGREIPGLSPTRFAHICEIAAKESLPIACIGSLSAAGWGEAVLSGGLTSLLALPFSLGPLSPDVCGRELEKLSRDKSLRPLVAELLAACVLNGYGPIRDEAPATAASLGPWAHAARCMASDTDLPFGTDSAKVWSGDRDGMEWLRSKVLADLQRSVEPRLGPLRLLLALESESPTSVGQSQLERRQKAELSSL